MKLNKEDRELIKKAQQIIIKNKSKFSTVGAALRSSSNQIYCGVSMSIESCEAVSICSEVAAISAMLSDGGRKIETIVAVSSKRNNSVLIPCGACRHIISQFGNPWVIVSNNDKIKLNELYPLPTK